jgi:ABC-type Fe3+-siderophore transport system permease subunit
MDKADRIQYHISWVLKFFIVVLAGLRLVAQDYFFFAASVFVLFLMFLPAIIERRLKITLPPEIDLLITILLYLHYVLGEFGQFYVYISWWDLFLHGLNALIIGMIGFILAYALLMTSRIEAKPFFISLFAVCFSVFFGVIWEIFEFSMDQLFGFNMQKSGLTDTITDLAMDVLGAIAAGTFGFVYIKQPEPTMIHNVISRFLRFVHKRRDTVNN